MAGHLSEGRGAAMRDPRTDPAVRRRLAMGRYAKRHNKAQAAACRCGARATYRTTEPVGMLRVVPVFVHRHVSLDQACRFSSRSIDPSCHPADCARLCRCGQLLQIHRVRVLPRLHALTKSRLCNTIQLLHDNYPLFVSCETLPLNSRSNGCPPG